MYLHSVIFVAYILTVLTSHASSTQFSSLLSFLSFQCLKNLIPVTFTIRRLWKVVIEHHGVIDWSGNKSNALQLRSEQWKRNDLPAKQNTQMLWSYSTKRTHKGQAERPKSLECLPAWWTQKTQWWYVLQTVYWRLLTVCHSTRSHRATSQGIWDRTRTVQGMEVHVEGR